MSIQHNGSIVSSRIQFKGEQLMWSNKFTKFFSIFVFLATGFLWYSIVLKKNLINISDLNKVTEKNSEMSYYFVMGVVMSVFIIVALEYLIASFLLRIFDKSLKTSITYVTLPKTIAFIVSILIYRIFGVTDLIYYTLLSSFTVGAIYFIILKISKDYKMSLVFSIPFLIDGNVIYSILNITGFL